MPTAIIAPKKKKPAAAASAQKKKAPPSRKKGPSGSPIPLGGFMPPPVMGRPVTRATTHSASVKAAPYKPPTKVAAAKNIESAARALLKLSRQLKA